MDEPQTATTNVQAEEPVERVPFRTKDLNQAAFVWCQPGAELLRLDGASEQGTTIWFVLTLPVSEEELRTLIYDYANRKCRVEPQQFVAQQNNLRDLLHGSLAQADKRRRKQKGK